MHVFFTLIKTKDVMVSASKVAHKQKHPDTQPD